MIDARTDWKFEAGDTIRKVREPQVLFGGPSEPVCEVVRRIEHSFPLRPREYNVKIDGKVYRRGATATEHCYEVVPEKTVQGGDSE